MEKENETEMEVSCLADGFSVYGIALTATGPIAIYSAEELHDINNDLSADYILMNDIDLSGWGTWEPIGNAVPGGNVDGTQGSKYKGHFDGNGHTISNLRLSVTGEDGLYNIGLFGNLGGSVENLIIQDARIEGTATNSLYIGVLAGSEGLFGTISSCKVSGDIDIVIDKFGWAVGGIVGDCSGKMSACEGNVTITVEKNSTSSTNIGGIMGQHNYSAEKLINRGNIKVISDNTKGHCVNIGGIAGSGSDGVKQCANYGMINVDMASRGKADASILGMKFESNIGGVQGRADYEL